MSINFKRLSFLFCVANRMDVFDFFCLFFHFLLSSFFFPPANRSRRRRSGGSVRTTWNFSDREKIQIKNKNPLVIQISAMVLSRNL